MHCHRPHFYGPFTLSTPSIGLCDLVLLETEEFLLCFSSVSAISRLQAVVPIFDLAAKVLSSSPTTDLLPLYNTAHHLIRDVNSCKEPFSHLCPSSSVERNICASLNIQNTQCVHLRQVLLNLSRVIQNCAFIIQTVSKNTMQDTIAKWS